MIITCASCLTKFNLDDSRISAKGIKVRCSRCKHVFYVVPPPETKEEIIEGFESFSKYHEDLMEPSEHKEEAPSEVKIREEEIAPEEKEEDAFLFSEKIPTEKGEALSPPPPMEKLVLPEKMEELPPVEPEREEKGEAKPAQPKILLRAPRKGPSRFIVLFIILILLVFGVFYLWNEMSSGGSLSPYLEYPVKKITEFWNQIWGVERADLIVGELSGYEEKIGGTSFHIIEGKVKNESRFNKKHIKIRVEIFDQDKLKVAEKEAICGRSLSREELKKQPAEFFNGEMVFQPLSKEEGITPSGKAAPFMVIFKDLPSQAKEFKVDIVEAPNL